MRTAPSGIPEEHVSGLERLKQMMKPMAARLAASHRIQRFAHRSAYFGQFHAWCASHPCPSVPDRLAVFDRIREEIIGQQPVAYLEFGVFAGTSIRWWSQHSRHRASTFVGFDSFEGLPERWGSMAAGTFSTNGNVPQIDDPRVAFEKGWFSETVPPFLSSFTRGGRRIVAHLDADLYSSTLVVLLHLAPHLRAGDVLLFDEFSDYMDEFRALDDAIHAHPLRYRAVVRTPVWTQVALEILPPRDAESRPATPVVRGD